ncbi:MAG: response regulator [Patescibacteria group bacterium]|nr:response regulator [Patescibacteria group bacterium]
MPEKKKSIILVVEDDKFLLKAYESKLSRAGFQVEKATDGEETMEKLKVAKPNIILLDLVMPNVDGFEVLAKVHKDPKFKSIPVIVVSNLGQESDVEKAKSLGAAEYLVKSDYSLQQIVDLIKKKLKMK